MIDTLVAFLRCPRCTGAHLRDDGQGVSCTSCHARYVREGDILDLMPDEASEVITPFQRLMQSPLVVSVYEKAWRRLGYFIASSRSFDREVATVLRMQQDGGGPRLLDLACGTGVFTRPLARRTGGIVVGLDMSFPMLRHASRLARQEGLLNVAWIRGTAFRIPFIAEAFTGVNCCGALHLFDRPEAALGEIARVLHRSGRLTVQTTIRPARSAGFAYFLERFIRFGFFAEDGLRETIRSHGFKILESERHRISYTFLARHISCPPQP